MYFTLVIVLVEATALGGRMMSQGKKNGMTSAHYQVVFLMPFLWSSPYIFSIYSIPILYNRKEYTS